MIDCHCGSLCVAWGYIVIILLKLQACHSIMISGYRDSLSPEMYWTKTELGRSKYCICFSFGKSGRCSPSISSTSLLLLSFPWGYSRNTFDSTNHFMNYFFSSSLAWFLRFAFHRHWINVGNLLPLTGLLLHMFFLVEEIWLCRACLIQAIPRKFNPKTMWI